METRARQRYVRIAPRKLRIVVDLVRGREVGEALSILQFTPKTGSQVISKLLTAAQANAGQTGELRGKELVVQQAFVDEGPSFKRLRPRARGMRDIYKKRTSHVTVVLEEKS